LATSEIIRLHQIIHPIRSPGNFLKDFKGESDRRFAGAILANQQSGLAIRQRQFEILQAAEIMNVESAYHDAIIRRFQICVQLEF
jgi:hypothetical protein